MNAANFDDFARRLARPIGRRRLLAGAAGLLASLGRRRRAGAAHNCCGTAADCGDCTCMCLPDGSFQGCCCGDVCTAGPGNSGACCQGNQPTCCGGVCCPLLQVCAGPGVCADSCPPGDTTCGDYCCPADQVCVEKGVCGATCKPGAEKCGGHCCEYGCSGTECAPTPCNATTCNGQCCGGTYGTCCATNCDLAGLGCGVSCESGLLPCYGTCILPCGPGLTLNIDTCSCECPGETVPCGKGCANLNTNKRNCGQCGKRCKLGQRCRGGQCRTPCKN
jgi:hypothetical protein